MPSRKRHQPQSDQTQTKDPVGDMVGAWEFSNADHDKICNFNFRADAAPGGYKLDIDKNCPNVFPSTKDIVAWTIDNYGNLRLLDAGNGAVIELTQVEGGMFDGFKPEEGRYILQAAAAVQARSADDLVGDWAIARGTGKPICMLTLANTPAAPVPIPCAETQARLRRRWSRVSAQPRGAWTTANWCYRRRAGRRGASKKTTSIPGSACRKRPIRFCWCGSADNATQQQIGP